MLVPRLGAPAGVHIVLSKVVWGMGKDWIPLWTGKSGFCSMQKSTLHSRHIAHF